jgi:hypothetical protein
MPVRIGRVSSVGSTPSIVIRNSRTHHVVETIHPFGTHYQGHGVRHAVGDVFAFDPSFRGGVVVGVD